MQYKLLINIPHISSNLSIIPEGRAREYIFIAYNRNDSLKHKRSYNKVNADML